MQKYTVGKVQKKVVFSFDADDGGTRSANHAAVALNLLQSALYENESAARHSVEHIKALIGANTTDPETKIVLNGMLGLRRIMANEFTMDDVDYYRAMITVLLFRYDRKIDNFERSNGPNHPFLDGLAATRDKANEIRNEFYSEIQAFNLTEQPMECIT